MADLGCGCARVCRHRDRAAPRDREIGLRDLDPVVQIEQDPIAALHMHPLKMSGDPEVVRSRSPKVSVLLSSMNAILSGRSPALRASSSGTVAMYSVRSICPPHTS